MRADSLKKLPSWKIGSRSTGKGQRNKGIAIWLF